MDSDTNSCPDGALGPDPRTRQIAQVLRAVIPHLIRADTPTAVARAVCRALVDDGGFQAASLFFADGLVTAPDLLAHEGTSPVATRQDALTAMSTREPTVLREDRSIPAHHDGVVVAFPLLNRDSAVGALVLRASSTHDFAADRRAQLAELASYVSTSLDVLRSRGAPAAERTRTAECTCSLPSADPQDRPPSAKAVPAEANAQRALLEHFPDLVSRFDREGRVRYVNPAVTRATGVSLEQVAGRTVGELNATGDAALNLKLEHSLARVAASGSPETVEAPLLTLLGPRVFEIRHVPEFDAQGAVVGVLGIARDLTAQRAMERQTFLLNYALDNVGEGIFLMKGDSPCFTHVNQSGASSLGYRPDELTGGMGIFDIDPEWTPERWSALLPILRARRQFTIETTHRARDGRTFPVEITGNYFDFDGETYNMAIVRNISARRAAEAALRASELTYRTLVTAMAEGAYFQDASGRITAVNPAAERILGRDSRELIGDGSEILRDFFRDDGTSLATEEHPSEKTLRTGLPLAGVVLGCRGKDGRVAWVSLNTQPILDGEGALPTGVVTTFHDITEQRQAEADLRASEHHYRALADNTPDFIVRWDRSLTRVFVNPAFAAALGKAQSDLLGTPFGAGFGGSEVTKGELARLAEKILGVFASGVVADMQMTFSTEHGPRETHLKLVPEFDDQGCVHTVLGVSHDVTALRESERKLSTLTEHSPDLIMRFDPAGRCLYANGTLDRIAGGCSQRLRDLPLSGWLELGHELASLSDEIAGISPDGGILEKEVWLRLPEENRRFEVRMVPEWHERSTLASVLLIARDVTDRYRALEAQRSSELRFRQVTENVDEVFWLTDAGKSRMFYVSPAYERVYGRTCESLYAAPFSWLDAVHPEDRDRVEQALPDQLRGTFDIEYRILAGSSVRLVHERAFPIRDDDGHVYRIAGVAEDVTRRSELEAQLRQSQKMDAVGQLAGGIAHDFNNLLAVIQLQSGVLERLVHDPQVLVGIREVLRASDRAADLIRQLLAFSRRQPLQMTAVDMGAAIVDMGNMLERLLAANIRLRMQASPDLPSVYADRGMLQQVVLNLALNARDAMPDGGVLTISAERVGVTPEQARVHGADPALEFVRLSVEDTGTGISAENLPRIFEPFFTTKEVGRGTGLGLATVFGIVRQHGGWVDVQSALGHGSRFNVFLPVAGEPGTAAATDRPSPPPPRGDTTILLVEDSPALRAAMRAALEEYGCRVLEADCASVAVTRWDEAGGNVDLLVADIVMPGELSGRDLASELTSRRSSLKVLYTTGYDARTSDHAGAAGSVSSILQKPYSATALVAAVRRALNEPAG